MKINHWRSLRYLTSFLPTGYLGSPLFLQMDEGTPVQLRTQKALAIELVDPPLSAPTREAEDYTENLRLQHQPNLLYMRTDILAHHAYAKSEATAKPVLP